MTLRAYHLLAGGLLPGRAAAEEAVTRPEVEALRADLEEILGGSEYQQPELSWLRELAQQFLAWLREVMEGWWAPGVYQLRETWPVLYWGLVILLLGLLALLLYHIALTISLAFRERTTPQESLDTPGAPPDPEALRRRSVELAGRGRYREAILILHEALLHSLDRMGVLRFDVSRTNWELAAGVEAPALRGEMLHLAGRLDALLYGSAAADEAEYVHCAGVVERALEVAR